MPMFAGYQQTLLEADDPAVIAFTQGCQLDCWFCHNWRLIPVDRSVDKGDELFNFLERDDVKRFFPLVIISGGEPFIHGRKLSDALKRIRDLGYSIRVDTNGINYERIIDFYELGLYDSLAMDVKTGLNHEAGFYDDSLGFIRYGSVISNSIRHILDAGIPTYFRVVLTPKLVNAEDLIDIAGYIHPEVLHVHPFNHRTCRRTVSPYSRKEIEAIVEEVNRHSENVDWSQLWR